MNLSLKCSCGAEIALNDADQFVRDSAIDIIDRFRNDHLQCRTKTVRAGEMEITTLGPNCPNNVCANH